ncbi:hypothetical protein Goshw_023997 [Gossypium schwendimanii]|uniref:RNase H type-1 domain-containing protein n=1 Tax=Gossypium schwendimanii TaxID=34291 RepID=A0A7J9MEG5_GOSSC|nr:hypothetical protein [Gossypium schwendimanii]
MVKGNFQIHQPLSLVGIDWSCLFGIISFWDHQPLSTLDLFRNVYLSRLDEGFATVRGLVSDQNGSWIIGFSIFLENYTVMEAELWGILDRLKLILDRGFERVLIQTDNLEATTAIQEDAFGISNSTLLRRIDQILIKVKPWRIQHIPGRKTLLLIVLPR